MIGGEGAKTATGVKLKNPMAIEVDFDEVDRRTKEYLEAIGW